MEQATLFDAADIRDGNPYLARQQVLYELIRMPLFERDCGIWPIGAPTGAGKNHVMYNVAGQVLQAGSDGKGGWKALRGRRYLVICIPQKANRSDAAAKLRAKARTAGYEKPADTVIDLQSLSDGFEAYAFGYGAPAQAKARPCPFSADGDGQTKLESAWDSCVSAAVACRRARDAGADAAYRAFLTQQARQRESALRRVVRGNVSADPTQLAEVAACWPAAKLALPGPKIIVTTPEKMFYPVDTVIAGKVDFFEAKFQKEAAFLIDEIDHVKSDWLSQLIADPFKYQPDEVVRQIHDRVRPETSLVDGIVRGSSRRWRKTWGNARWSKRHKGSAANKETFSERNLAERVGKVEASWGKLCSDVDVVYDELGLDYPFKSHEEIEAARPTSRMMFGSDEAAIGLNADLGSLVVVRDDVEQINWIRLRASAPEATPLIEVLGRCNGVIREAAYHLQLCCELYDSIYTGSPAHDEEATLQLVLDGFGIRNGESGEDRFWTSLVRSIVRTGNRGSRQRKESWDMSVYASGVRYYYIDDSAGHALSSRLYANGVEFLPEVMLAGLARFAPVVCLSATWSAPCIQCPDWEYLSDTLGSVGVWEEWESLKYEVARLTDELNARARDSYDVRAGIIVDRPELGELAEFASGRSASHESPDEVRSKAVAGFYSIYPDISWAQAAAARVSSEWFVQETGDAAGYKAVELARALEACSAWARGVSAKTSYAGLSLTQVDVGKESSAYGAAYRDLAVAIVSAESAKGGGFWDDSIAADPASAIVFIKSDGWDEVAAKAAKDLSSGSPRLIAATAAAGGFSKNLQYIPPAKLEPYLVTLDFGYKPAKDEDSVDLDFIYCDCPRHLMVSQAGNGSDIEQERLLGVIEREELWQRGEVCAARKSSDVRKLLFGAVAKA